MKNNRVLTVTFSAFFLALAFLLPFLTGQIPEIGSMLCPMHIPVLLCGFICGGPWGLVVGFTAPLLRSAILGMPPLFPAAVCMAFELSAYGGTAGWLYRRFPRKKRSIYGVLLIAMIAGRLVWGVAMFTLLGISGGSFTFAAFLAGAVTDALPGIVVQIVFVPILVLVLDNPKILKLRD